MPANAQSQSQSQSQSQRKLNALPAPSPRQTERDLPPLLSGAIAGFLATGPMTYSMIAMHQELPRKEKSPLPPASLTFQIVEHLVGSRPLARSPNFQAVAAIAAHFGMGTAAGVLYSHSFAKIPASRVVRGAGFGAAFWAANYLFLNPAIGFRAQGPRMPARRNGMMLAAHLVWGASLAYAEDVFRSAGRELLVGARKSEGAE